MREVLPERLDVGRGHLRHARNTRAFDRVLAQVQSADLSRAALWGGVLATTFAVMQFLFSPLVGSLSDRFGRRPVLLTSLTVMALVVALVLFRRVRINPAYVD